MVWIGENSQKKYGFCLNQIRENPLKYTTKALQLCIKKIKQKTMENQENSQKQISSKIDLFEIEEIESRLEQKGWFPDYVCGFNEACALPKDDAPNDVG
jgi:predicted component of type VI protein secretion system